MRRLTLLLPLAAACAFVGKPPPTPASRAWQAARDAHTRSAKFYDRLELRAAATAVYLSPEVRLCRAEQVATWRAMTAEERAALVASEQAEGAQWDDILLAFYAPNQADDDLDRKNSVWRVALVLPGEGELLPAEIRQLQADPQTAQLFPFIGSHDTLYRIRFAVRGGTPLADRPFHLLIAGAEGRLDFDFSAAGAAKP